MKLGTPAVSKVTLPRCGHVWLLLDWQHRLSSGAPLPIIVCMDSFHCITRNNFDTDPTFSAQQRFQSPLKSWTSSGQGSRLSLFQTLTEEASFGASVQLMTLLPLSQLWSKSYRRTQNTMNLSITLITI